MVMIKCIIRAFRVASKTCAILYDGSNEKPEYRNSVKY
jgi:hypothetical protein